jgi:hypothetical protein
VFDTAPLILPENQELGVVPNRTLVKLSLTTAPTFKIDKNYLFKNVSSSKCLLHFSPWPLHDPKMEPKHAIWGHRPHSLHPSAACREEEQHHTLRRKRSSTMHIQEEEEEHHHHHARQPTGEREHHERRRKSSSCSISGTPLEMTIFRCGMDNPNYSK